MANILVYELYGKLYINLTNRCTNECIFCLRQDKDDVCGQTLWLDNEDYSAEDVILQLENFAKKQNDTNLTSDSPKVLSSDEVIFCGYGEPLLKLDIFKEVAKYIKENYKNVKIRVNTNGHANAIYKTNVAEEFKGLIDSVSISLNAPSEKEYNEICKPKIDNAYKAMLDFTRECKKVGIDVSMSVVSGFDNIHDINIEDCEKIAKNLGAKFRNREFITNGY